MVGVERAAAGAGLRARVQRQRVDQRVRRRAPAGDRLRGGDGLGRRSTGASRRRSTSASSGLGLGDGVGADDQAVIAQDQDVGGPRRASRSATARVSGRPGLQ